VVGSEEEVAVVRGSVAHLCGVGKFSHGKPIIRIRRVHVLGMGSFIRFCSSRASTHLSCVPSPVSLFPLPPPPRL